MAFRATCRPQSLWQGSRGYSRIFLRLGWGTRGPIIYMEGPNLLLASEVF